MPNVSTPREEGVGRRVVVDHKLERAEMSLGGADRAFDDWKLRDARGCQILRPGDQHGDVEMLGEQPRGFDRAFVAAVDQRDAFARQADQREIRHRLGGGRDQRGHLRSRLRGIRRPAGGLAHVHECERRRLLQIGGDFGEKRRFLRAADDQRVTLRGGRAEPLDLGAAEMMRGRYGTAAAAPHAFGVERHRVFARADQDLRAFRHRVWHLVGDYL